VRQARFAFVVRTGGPDPRLELRRAEAARLCPEDVVGRPYGMLVPDGPARVDEDELKRRVLAGGRSSSSAPIASPRRPPGSRMMEVWSASHRRRCDAGNCDGLRRPSRRRWQSVPKKRTCPREHPALQLILVHARGPVGTNIPYGRPTTSPEHNEQPLRAGAPGADPVLRSATTTRPPPGARSPRRTGRQGLRGWPPRRPARDWSGPRIAGRFPARNPWRAV